VVVALGETGDWQAAADTFLDFFQREYAYEFELISIHELDVKPAQPRKVRPLVDPDASPF
jgi:hypothetical protein